MTPLGAVRAGIARVDRGPAIVLTLWLVTVLASVPAGLAVHGAVERQLGGSLEAEGAAAGGDYDWLTEFGAVTGADALSSTLVPSIVGFGAVARNLSAFVDGVSQPALIAATGAGYALLWTFLAGGIIDRYARDRALRSHGFFQACGGYFPRLLRLGLLSALVYGVLFGWFHSWLFDRAYDTLVRNLAVERTAFAIRVGLSAVFVGIVCAVNLIFDYAKIRLVIEDRRSAVGALRAAVRFVARQPLGTSAVYLGDALLFAAVLAVYAVAAPGAGRASLGGWMTLAVGQAYVAARLWTKLVFWAAEAAWFQSRLAHAGYVAAPLPRWPESAAAEGVGEGLRS